jgi:Flp pilus assembly pilin Flp
MKKTLAVLKRLHEDDRGAEGLEKLLIIAAIVLPLLGLLIAFRKTINDWVVTLWNQIKGEADDPIIRP